MLIALAITAALLTATLAALNASFMAYQATTEEASTHTIARLTINRLLALIRSGRDFGPFPADPKDSIVESNSIEFIVPSGQTVIVEWDEADKALYLTVVDPETEAESKQLLLGGVVAQEDDEGEAVPPFTLEFEKGTNLYRATIDLAVLPDDNASLSLEGDGAQMIRLVASAMPRSAAY
jgi:hypothetical protein